MNIDLSIITWETLFNTGKPFVVTDEKFGDCVYYPIDLEIYGHECDRFTQGNVIIDKLNYKNWKSPVSEACTGRYFIDWFQTEDAGMIQKCKCDFYSVILTSGCRCGGI